MAEANVDREGPKLAKPTADLAQQVVPLLRRLPLVKIGTPRKGTPRWRGVALLNLLVTLGSCACVLASTRAASETLRPWERSVGDSLEARGVSRIERFGNRYLLTTYCRGVHSIYISPTSPIDPQALVGRFVRARYVYVQGLSPKTECVRAPCPPAVETTVELRNVEVLTVSDEQRWSYQQSCAS